MKSVKIMLVAVALLITVSAFSESLGIIPVSARQLGMGGAALAVADDAFAWTQNPAGLATLASKPKEGSRWSWDVAGSYSQSNDIIAGEKIKLWDIDFGANDPAEGMGFGGGYQQAKIDIPGTPKLTRWGGGFGMKLRSESLKGLSWGVNVQRNKAEAGSSDISKTTFDVGLLYDVPIAENKAIKLGLVVNDVSDELGDLVGGGPVGSLIGRTWSMGVALPVSDKITLAVDNRGVGQVLHIWNAGLEWKSNGWAIRAGDWDGSLTLGAGYKGNNWYVDAGYGNAPTNKVLALVGGGSIPSINFWALTAGCNF